MRALLNSAINWHPVFAAMRPASSSARLRTPIPPSSRAEGPLPRKASAAALTASGATSGRARGARAIAGPSAAFQAVSAGRISVAICPGAVHAASTASAPSAATVRDEVDVFTQSDIGRATPSMSEVSGASWAM